MRMGMEDCFKPVKGALGGFEASVSMDSEAITVNVKPEFMSEVAEVLRGKGFDHVKSVTVIDYPERSVMRICYHASSYENECCRGVVVELCCEVDRSNPRVKSLVRVWRSAEFQEREAYEMFGVVFEEHPDLRPILLPEELASKHPLRKDFKVVEEEYIVEYKGGGKRA